MSERMKPILGALVTAYVFFYLGTMYFFGPILANDAPAEMMPAWASLAVVSVLLILLYDWVNVSVGSPVRSALIIALSQILLVDVYYAMNGSRGLAAAGVSAALLIVGWTAVGIVYGKLSGGAPAGAEAQTAGATGGDAGTSTGGDAGTY